MHQREISLSTHDGPVEAALADYFTHRDRGESVNIEQLIAAHPGCEAGLRNFLNQERKLHGVMADAPLGTATIENLSSRSLGDFRILRELGRGGMGVVYEAEQVSLGRRVALKVLPYAGMLDKQQLARFKNEARAAATLDHPNIVAVHSVGSEGSVHYFAMQLVAGQSLAQLVASLRRAHCPSEPSPENSLGDAALSTDAAQLTTDFDQSAPPNATGLPQSAIDTAPSTAPSTLPAPGSQLPAYGSREFCRTVAQLGIQAAEALQHAHEQGVLHRDIKPSNLMLDAEGKLYITDFGLARIEADAGMTMTGDIIGTLRYMAPEQALAKRVVIDNRADVYSLGATLYELLTLRPVFGETDRAELLKQIAFEEPLPLRKLDRHITVEMETIVLKAVAKSPDDRYQTAQLLADDLHAFLECQPIKAKPPSLVERAMKWSRRHVAIVWSAAALLVAGMVILAVSNIRIRQESAEKEVALATARKAVDQMLVRVSEFELRDVPSAESIRVGLLEDALKFYEGLAKQGTAEPNVGQELAAVLCTVCGIQRELGRFEDSLKTGERAIRVIEELAAANPHDSTWLLGLALAEQMHAYNWSVAPPGPNTKQVEEHYRRALAIFAELERKWPEEPVPTAMCMRYLAKSALQRGDEAEVVRLLRKGIEQNEKYLAYIETKTPKIEMGEDVSFGDDVYVAHTRTIENARISLCWACAELEEPLDSPADSEAFLRKGLYHANILHDENPRSVPIDDVRRYLIRKLAEALANTGQIDESVKLHEALVESADDSSAPILRLQVLNKAAGSAWKSGNLDRAVSLAEEAVELAREHQLKHAAMGRIYYILSTFALSRGQPETAESLARKSIEAFIYPGESFGSADYPYSLLAEALRQSGKLDDAVDEFREAFRLDPTNPFVCMILGKALLQKGLWDEAMAAFRESVRLAPNDSSTLNSVAWALITCQKTDLCDPDEAVKLSEQAVELAPSHGECWNTLGVAHYRAGNHRDAVEALQKSCELIKNEPTNFFFLAMAEWQLGNHDGAREWYAKAIKWMERHPQVVAGDLYRFRAEAEDQLGIPKRASTEAESATEKHSNDESVAAAE